MWLLVATDSISEWLVKTLTSVVPLLCCLQVMYQGETLVDVLVSTRAHNYLEFKAVDSRCGSVCALWPVTVTMPVLLPVQSVFCRRAV